MFVGGVEGMPVLDAVKEEVVEKEREDMMEVDGGGVALPVGQGRAWPVISLPVLDSARQRSTQEGSRVANDAAYNEREL